MKHERSDEKYPKTMQRTSRMGQQKKKRSTQKERAPGAPNQHGLTDLTMKTKKRKMKKK